jgi:hypothetical protein
MADEGVAAIATPESGERIDNIHDWAHIQVCRTMTARGITNDASSTMYMLSSMIPFIATPCAEP